MHCRVSKRARQIYLYCILLLSVIALPLILLYSTGYHINLKYWRLETTGALQISTLPNHAVVSLPELEQTTTAPAVLQQIPPGQYQLTITAPGYLSWSGDIDIAPQQTTVLKNMILWRELMTVTELTQLPTVRVTTTPSQTVKQLALPVQRALSELGLSSSYTVYDIPVGHIVLDVTSGKLYRLTPVDQTITVTELDEDVTAIDWQTTTKQLLIVKHYELKIYDPQSNDSWVITRQSLPLQQAWWHPLGYYVLYRSNSTIAVSDSRNELRQTPVTLYQGQAVTAAWMNASGTELYISDDNHYFMVVVR